MIWNFKLLYSKDPHKIYPLFIIWISLRNICKTRVIQILSILSIKALPKTEMQQFMQEFVDKKVLKLFRSAFWMKDKVGYRETFWHLSRFPKFAINFTKKYFHFITFSFYFFLSTILAKIVATYIPGSIYNWGAWPKFVKLLMLE